MTDRDEIILPAQPVGNYHSYSTSDLLEFARAAVRADRERRREQPPANPVVHRAPIKLSKSGRAWATVLEHDKVQLAAQIYICWTNDGRAWIDNKRNRELAQWLRMWKGVMGNEAADALDGGVR